MTEKRKYRKPVAWLGGRDLLANLKYFLLFAAFKGKLDPRDWMNPEVFPPKESNAREKTYQKNFEESFAGLKDEFWFDYFADSGDGMTAGYAIAYMCMSDLFARLPADWESLSARDLRKALDDDAPAVGIRSLLAAGHRLRAKRECKGLAAALAAKIASGDLQGVITDVEKEKNGVVLVASAEPESDPAAMSARGFKKLPRGAFLFVGGDTAYHVADFAGLGLRFQKVFDWAFEDLKQNFRLSKDEAQKKYWDEPVRRPLFGLPGNHDYYDMIDGFNRQFARPVTRETNFINLDGRDLTPQLRLWPFKRFQTASYVAIKLPFGWWFWGIDSELTRVDIRQQEFFKRAYGLHDKSAADQQVRERTLRDLRATLEAEPTAEQIEHELKERGPRLARLPRGDRWPMPTKLIVATSEPTTVEGRRARDDDDTQDKTPQAFSFLDLTRPFLYLPGRRSQAPNNHASAQGKIGFRTPQEFRQEEIDLGLVDLSCRLDISGDTHHYARYWGDDSLGNTEAPSAENYACVVAGGGGASMSPTQTDYGEIEEQVLYPDKEISKLIINNQLFKPWVVIRGGNVWMAGLIIALIIFLGATVPKTHHDFTNAVYRKVMSVPHYIAPPQPGAAVSRLWSLILIRDDIRYVVKLSLLLLLAGWAIVGSGLYARWQFERLTRVHDWVRDKLENLRLTEKKLRHESLKDPSDPEPRNPYEEEGQSTKLYGDFLKDAASKVELQPVGKREKRAQSETEKEFENDYHEPAKLMALYKRFLDNTEMQTNPGVGLARVLNFWWISLLILVLTLCLCLTETVAYYGYVSQETHAGLFVLELIAISLSIFLATWYSQYLRKKLGQIPHYDEENRAGNLWRIIQFSVGPTHDYVPFWFLLMGPGLGVLILALVNYRHMMPRLPTFGNSTAILFSVFVAGAGAVVAIYYSKWLFDQSYRIKVNLYSYIPVMGLSAVALLTVIIAVLRCGVNQARFIIIDGLYLTAILGVIVGCIVLAALVGNHVRKGLRSFGFSVLGAWHGVLQLLVPFLLLWFGNSQAFAAALLLVIGFAALSLSLVHLNVNFLTRKFVLPVLWFLYGLAMLAVPLYWHREPVGLESLSPVVLGASTFVAVAIIAWALIDLTFIKRLSVAALVGGIAAVLTFAICRYIGIHWGAWLTCGSIGAVMSCVWLGWYFAVSLVFDGHANEAGSTARTEDYKQFIRFRVTNDTLTGFVIGLDFPRAPDEGETDPKLKPRLIDVFTLRCGSPPEPS